MVSSVKYCEFPVNDTGNIISVPIIYRDMCSLPKIVPGRKTLQLTIRSLPNHG